MSHPGAPLDYLTNSECIKSRSIWVIIVEFMVIFTKWALFFINQRTSECSRIY